MQRARERWGAAPRPKRGAGRGGLLLLSEGGRVIERADGGDVRVLSRQEDGEQIEVGAPAILMARALAVGVASIPVC